MYIYRSLLFSQLHDVLFLKVLIL